MWEIAASSVPSLFRHDEAPVRVGCGEHVRGQVARVAQVVQGDPAVRAHADPSHRGVSARQERKGACHCHDRKLRRF
jgi:hypothetical protein